MEAKMQIKAVLFDMDGTLIDTEKLFRIFWPMAFREYGYTMTDEQALAVRSLGRPFAPAKFREWFGEELDYTKVRAKRKELMDAYIAEHGVELKEGAEKLLQYLQMKGITTAVVTATDTKRAETYLGQLRILPYFTEIISAAEVEEGKPSPQVYQFACRKLGLAPEECLVAEDSPNGIESAYRAGCRVVMVPDQSKPDDEIKKMLFACVESLDKIIELTDGLRG